jgi:hypothetical protein
MGEDSFKNQDQEGYRSLWEMFQSPGRYTVRARSLADFETPDGFLNLLRVTPWKEDLNLLKPTG